VPKKIPQGSHNGSHIARKKGVYHYRRRLPGVCRGEICISLRARLYREAEHRAALVDVGFDSALRRARENVTDTSDLNSILRDYLRDCLDGDLQRRIDRQRGYPIYAYWWEPGDPETVTEADLRAIRDERSSLQYALAHNSQQIDTEDFARELLRQHGLPDNLLGPLLLGLTEARIRCWDVAERRTLGTEPLVFDPDLALGPPRPSTDDRSQPSQASAPLASTMVEPFGEWGRKSGGWRAGAENQAKVSLALFLEICGDRPINTYSRSDGDRFRTVLRSLPTTYRKSPKDRAKQLKEIIAEADDTNAKRIGDKTVKRHFWALSQFFIFLVETGRMPKGNDNPGRGFTFNTSQTYLKFPD
jgi:hypothetical protein